LAAFLASAFLATGLALSFLTVAAGAAGFAGAEDCAKETVANANITSAIIDFILIPLKNLKLIGYSVTRKPIETLVSV